MSERTNYYCSLINTCTVMKETVRGLKRKNLNIYLVPTEQCYDEIIVLNFISHITLYQKSEESGVVSCLKHLLTDLPES